MFQSRSVTSLWFFTFLSYRRAWTRRRSACRCTCRRDHFLSPSVEQVSESSLSPLLPERSAGVMYLALSVRTCNSKNYCSVSFDFVTQEIFYPPLRLIYSRILHHWEIGQHLLSVICDCLVVVVVRPLSKRVLPLKQQIQILVTVTCVDPVICNCK